MIKRTSKNVILKRFYLTESNFVLPFDGFLFFVGEICHRFRDGNERKDFACFLQLSKYLIGVKILILEVDKAGKLKVSRQ